MKLTFLALVVALACACSNHASSVIDERVKQFLGSDLVEVLRAPDRVASIRIDGALDARNSEGERIGDFPVLAHGPDLTQEQVAQLQVLIFDAANYQFDIAKGCEFMPGVVFRFEKSSETVDVLLCFSCDEWAFMNRGSWKIEDNDRARARLVAMARDVFPDDEVLAKLR